MASTDFDETFGSHSYKVTVKMLSASSGAQLDSVEYDLALTVTADVQDYYYAQEHSIEEDYTYVIGSTAREIQFGLTCREDDDLECTSYTQTFTLTDATGITASSTPVAWDSASGLLTLHSDLDSDQGQYDYEVKVDILEADTGFTASHTYYVYITIEEFPTIIIDDVDEED